MCLVSTHTHIKWGLFSRGVSQPNPKKMITLALQNASRWSIFLIFWFFDFLFSQIKDFLTLFHMSQLAFLKKILDNPSFSHTCKKKRWPELPLIDPQNTSKWDALEVLSIQPKICPRGWVTGFFFQRDWLVFGPKPLPPIHKSDPVPKEKRPFSRAFVVKFDWIPPPPGGSVSLPHIVTSLLEFPTNKPTNLPTKYLCLCSISPAPLGHVHSSKNQWIAPPPGNSVSHYPSTL